ncbi:MAG: formamidopyrimidine-DNA glycosylase [Tepidiforma sp.]|nr:DNA-formamidopyrimidine glycosylase family protein [Tepidiforma sp.]GIW18165.1 MAG: formamidopyrimidine-DNA glycosylase [Tepidiforma sp.]
MPEIPELEAIRGFFQEQLAGRTIAAAAVRIPVVFRTPASEFRETLPGDRFAGFRRRGKFLLFDLASGRVLAVNPMLTGRFQYVDPGTKPPAKTCLILDVEAGRSLRYADDRLMGKLYLLPADRLEAISGWADGGPDLLDPALDEAAWLQRIAKYRGGIKNVLVNAAFVQGIGNAYSDEILWEARINPYTPRTKISEDDLRRLFRAARAVMAWAEPLARAAMVKDGTLDYEERRDFLRVHRRGGQPCPRCGTPITEITANQRVTSFCRQCQPELPA